jgi:adenylate cyclase
MDTSIMDKDSFDSYLQTEMIENERFRNLVLAVIMGFLLIISVVISYFFHGEFRSFLGEEFNMYWVALFYLFILIRSLNVRRILGKRLKKGKSVPIYLAYTNTFFEISMVTLIMIVISQGIIPIYVLISPIPYLYFVFIILSTLDLNFRLCVFAGAVASFEYILLFLFFWDKSVIPERNPILNLELSFIAKGGVLLLAGIVTGFIAREIHNRVFRSYQAVSQRKNIETLFGQQVSPTIVDEILKSKQEIISRKIPVCVMFLDIRDFTPFVEKKSPEEIIQYQNDVFSMMIGIITQRNGIINQFMGDGFMATFGAPIPSQDDCQNAVVSALDIEMTLRKACDSGSIPETRIGIGIHTGEVVTGNVGTEFRKQYSITGNTVILAARLEQLNKQYDTTILISGAVNERIELDNTLAHSLGFVDIKGRSEPMEVFKII